MRLPKIVSGEGVIRLLAHPPLFAEWKNHAVIRKTACIEPQYKDLELVVQYCHAHLAYETKLFLFTEAGRVFLCLYCLFFALSGRLVSAHGCLDGFNFYLHRNHRFDHCPIRI